MLSSNNDLPLLSILPPGKTIRHVGDVVSDISDWSKWGIDAQLWAEGFLDMHGGKPVNGDADDDDNASINKGLLIGWFANMIMAGYDRGYRYGVDQGHADFTKMLSRELNRKVN